MDVTPRAPPRRLAPACSCGCLGCEPTFTLSSSPRSSSLPCAIALASCSDSPAFWSLDASHTLRSSRDAAFSARSSATIFFSSTERWRESFVSTGTQMSPTCSISTPPFMRTCAARYSSETPQFTLSSAGSADSSSAFGSNNGASSWMSPSRSAVAFASRKRSSIVSLRSAASASLITASPLSRSDDDCCALPSISFASAIPRRTASCARRSISDKPAPAEVEEDEEESSSASCPTPIAPPPLPSSVPAPIASPPTTDPESFCSSPVAPNVSPPSSSRCCCCTSSSLSCPVPSLLPDRRSASASRPEKDG
mmetsp:Transcript_13298/g.43798  ORF Transcript_13298/g.43798 Transcript_13298/m.43798 type:complete len:310 (+) Transcript_13298:4605-5534(+)